ncbi:MAG: type II toxin-antitoxin system mRNA interferase toxin, RelE/StbE family [Proteobacteria bacterium]|nr:type II toxin-antitoxin system mRNA interferase toxin, RelE/StbE family [Pseudomonadota bacterium]
MRNLRIRFTPEAAGLLSKFHPENKKLIKAAIKEIRRDPHLGDDLQEELAGFKSYKLKRYRILYRINEKENLIEIYYVGHRSDVYEQFRLLLNKLTP